MRATASLQQTDQERETTQSMKKLHRYQKTPRHTHTPPLFDDAYDCDDDDCDCYKVSIKLHFHFNAEILGEGVFLSELYKI